MWVLAAATIPKVFASFIGGLAIKKMKVSWTAFIWGIDKYTQQ